MKTSIKIYLSLFLSLSFFTVKAQEYKEAIQTANSIDYNYFYKNLSYLADDKLKGRDTGSEGYNMAANYLANEFKENGLLPFGDDNTFYQRVPLVKRVIVGNSVDFNSEKDNKKVTGEYGKDFSILINTKLEKIEKQQKLVFVGYGNIIPDEKINDYKGLDVKGKTVIVVIGKPDGVKASGAFDPFTKVQNAISQGASGIILFFPNNRLIQGIIFKQMHGFLKQPIVMNADTSLGKSMFDIDLDIAAFAKKKLVKKIFKQNGFKLSKELKRIEKGEFASVELQSTLNVSYKVNVKNNDCKNVVALLPGADTSLREEYIVVGAHLDHVGVGEPVKGDSIYNGMWDNATGSAALISLARACNEMKEKPKRSIVFVAYTGEEKGLIGSQYFAQKTNIQDKIVANQNIDMLGSLFEAKDLTPLGYTHSNLSQAVDFAGKAIGMEVKSDEEFESMYIQRSDQMSFIEIGVPILAVYNGFTAVDPKIDGKEFDDKWMKKVYHKPGDDLEQEFDKNGFIQSLKANYLTLYYISNVMETIQWNEESVFYKKYVLNEE